jgi:hypothetical protein
MGLSNVKLLKLGTLGCKIYKLLELGNSRVLLSSRRGILAHNNPLVFIFRENGVVEEVLDYELEQLPSTSLHFRTHILIKYKLTLY